MPTEEEDFDPVTYASDIRSEVPAYDLLQAAAISATRAALGQRVLELGAGTGETTARLLEQHPLAAVWGVDTSAALLRVAQARCPRARFRVGRMQDPLPRGPFDLVLSVLAVHHLHALEKASLFQRVYDVLQPGGMFVLGDLVTVENPADIVTEVDGAVDTPSRADEQLAWLREVGFSAELRWRLRDLAVLVAQRTAA
ncbi:MAG TPA: class I SAM-dependent methyltransferase [Polyangiaceae bacterium]|nr:class I SAM-dependent methyltransferase [Polyangiaceae bacterium]